MHRKSCCIQSNCVTTLTGLNYSITLTQKMYRKTSTLRITSVIILQDHINPHSPPSFLFFFTAVFSLDIAPPTRPLSIQII